MIENFQLKTLGSVCKDLIHLITRMHQICFISSYLNNMRNNRITIGNEVDDYYPQTELGMGLGTLVVPYLHIQNRYTYLPVFLEHVEVEPFQIETFFFFPQDCLGR